MNLIKYHEERNKTLKYLQYNLYNVYFMAQLLIFDVLSKKNC